MAFSKDAEFNWRPARRFIKASEFNAFGVSTNNNGIISMGATTVTVNCVLEEVSTFGFTGVRMDNALDNITVTELLPYDTDLSRPIDLRVWWTANDSTGTGSVNWRVNYRAYSPNGGRLGLSTTNALTTTIGLDTYPSSTAFSLAASPWGSLSGGTLAENVELLQWTVTMVAENVTNPVYLLGLELCYTPKRFAGPDGMRVPAARTAYMLGKTYTSNATDIDI